MFYNFVKYLKNQFSSESIYTNIYFKQSTQSELPNRLMLVRETGGAETVWFNFARKTIQVITRDIDVTKARKLAWDVYELFMDKGQFGLILPANTVDSVTYPSVQTAQINALQIPTSLGEDDEGRSEFSTNYQVIYRRA